MEHGDNASTAMEAIRRLRPAWLLSRGPDPVVYVDNVRRAGGVDALFSDATTRWVTATGAG